MTGGSSPRLELTAAGTQFAFRRCPPGSFLMGSALSEPGREPAETRRRARLTREFWILETQTTQRMWRAVMGSNPSEQTGARLPAEHVSWFDASDFAAALTEIFKFRFWRFALPTEAQWEYACRAGTDSPFYCGRTLDGSLANIDDRAGTTGRYLGRACDVGLYPPNPWGLFDMAGNVWEWCADWRADYPAGDAVDPTGPASGEARVLRGGSWHSVPSRCRSAFRHSDPPEHKHGYVGCRVVLAPNPDAPPALAEAELSQAPRQ